MKEFTATNIRNVALAGHSRAGKTTLAEALLFKAGATDRLGKVQDGNTVCDYDPEEIKRQVSVSSTIVPFVVGQTKINLLDTPGLFDFAAGMREGIRAAANVVITLSGKSGLSVGAEKAYKLAIRQKKAKLIFISKMDAEHANYFKVLDQLTAAFGAAACPMVFPHYVGQKVESYVDLIRNTAYVYDDKGNRTEIPIPAEEMERVEQYRNALAEVVAESDDVMMDKFFSGEEFTHEELIAGMKRSVIAGTVAPVFCGSGTTLAGVDLLMDALVDLLPSPDISGGEVGVDQNGNEVRLTCSDTDPLAAYVFKTVADPFVGKLSYVKVLSGVLNSSCTPVNSRTGQPERLGKLIYTKGKKQEDATNVHAGDIVAITKMPEALTGDTLCDPKRVVTLNPTSFPEPCLSMAVRPKGKGDDGKIAQAINRLKEEDPTIRYENNVETRQQLLSGLGEQHLDVVVSKLKGKFGVEVELYPPRVAYRETIRKKVKVQGRHKKQSGGHGQFGDVWIEFEPCDSDSLVFEEKVFGGAVPKNFFPAVEKGLQESVKKGVLAGYPVVGLKATLVDGSYHPVDSSEMAFKTAASLAFKAGMAQASPVILEPIGNLKVYVPDDYTGDIMGDLNKRRGRVMGMNPSDDNLQEVEAEVPLSEMNTFASDLRSITQGRGHFTLTFARYEQLPSHLEAAVIAQAKEMEEE